MADTKPDFDEGDFETPPPDPVALEIDLARLLWHASHLVAEVDAVLGSTRVEGRMAALHKAVRSTSSKRELRDALVAAGVALAEAKDLCDSVEDRDLCDRPDNALPLARAVALRRAEAAVTAAAIATGTGKSFVDLQWALDDLAAVKARLDDGESLYPFNARTIPAAKDTEPRRWLYGRAYLRETVSALVAPGGVGKSIVAIVESLALATGRRLIHDKAYKPRRVLYWNLEEGVKEVERRFTAVAKNFNITPEDYEGCLFYESGLEHPLKVASAERNGFTLNTAALAKMKRTILATEIDVLILDPVVSAHGVPENDTTAMDAVLKALARLAVETNCAILLVHHARKSGSGGGGRGRVLDADDVRGASSFVDACRIVRLAQRMTAEEAVLMTIDELARWKYLRLTDGKVNYAPPNEHTKWLQLVSVGLENGDVENPDGDHVGVPMTWEPPALTADLPADIVQLVQAQAKGANYQHFHTAANWFGKAIAGLVGVEPGSKTGRAKLRRLIDLWIENGILVLVRRPTSGRNSSNFVGAPSDATPAGVKGVVLPFGPLTGKGRDFKDDGEPEDDPA